MHIRGVLGAEEDDHRGDLLGLREAPDRHARPLGGECLVARHAAPLRELVGEAALAHPERRLDGPRGERVHAHAGARVAVGEPARERQLGRLAHRVGEVRPGWPLARGRGHVHDPPPAALGHARRGRAHQPHRRHHVQLPLDVPVLVAQLVERPHRARARVVHQHVERAEAPLALLHHQLRRGGCRHVDGEPLRPPALGRALLGGRAQGLLAAGHEQHRRALGAQHAGRLQPDPEARSGDHAGPSLEAEVHAAIMSGPFDTGDPR